MHNLSKNKNPVNCLKYISLGLLNDKGLTFSEKSLLAMLYAIQFNGRVDIHNILIRWVERKKFVTNNYKIPKQLSITLDSLVSKNHLVKVFEGKKLAYIQLKEVYGKANISVSDALTKRLDLKLNEFLVAVLYAATEKKFRLCFKFAANRIGIHRISLRKYARSLEDKGIIKNNKLTKDYQSTENTLRYFKRVPGDKSFEDRRSFSTQRYKYIFISNINCKTSFFRMENKKLIEYLDMSSEQKNQVAQQIRMILHQKGSQRPLDEILNHLDQLKFQLPENLWDKTFMNSYKFAAYVAAKMTGAAYKTYSLEEMINNNELLHKSQLVAAGETEDYFSVKYIKWRLKRLNTKDISFFNEEAFVNFVVSMLKKDFRSPRETLNWDEDYDPTLVVEKPERRIYRKEEACELDSRTFSIAEIMKKINMRGH